MPTFRRSLSFLVLVAEKILLLYLLTSSAKAADHFSIILDWFINPDHAPLLVAQQIGAYRDEGLDVELLPPSDPAMGPKLAAAGQADLALTGEPQFLEQVSAGLDLARVGVLIDRPLSTLIALQGSGIATLADLRGRKIGYGAGGVEQTMVAAMLQNAGVAPSGVQMIQVGEQLSVALLSHQVDAVSVFRNFEPLELARHNAAIVSFDYETHGIPPFDEMIFVTRREAAQDPRLIRFLRATDRGLAYLRAHPKESWALVSHAYPDLDDALNHAAWTATLPFFAPSAIEMNAAAYARFAAFMRGHRGEGDK